MLAILEGDRPEKPENVTHLRFTEGLWETIEKCWVEDRSARPDVEDVLSCLSGDPLPKRRGRSTTVRKGGPVYKRILGAFQ